MSTDLEEYYLSKNLLIPLSFPFGLPLIRGYIDKEDGTPKITAYVQTPLFDELVFVDFIIDTGSNNTCLSYSTLLKAGISPDALPASAEILIETMNGTITGYTFPWTGDVTFHFKVSSNQNNRIYYRETLDTVIVIKSYDVIGRDLLYRYDLKISAPSNDILLKPNEESEGNKIKI